MNAAERFDALGLLSARTRPQAVFGDVDIGSAAIKVNTTRAVNAVPAATVQIDLSRLAGRILEYAAPLAVSAGRPGGSELLFAGSVLGATPQRDLVTVSASGEPGLHEQMVGVLATWALPVPEHFHVLGRGAGLADTQLNIAGLEELPVEVFEVIAPLSGVQLQAPVTVGAVRVLPAGRAAGALEHLVLDSQLRHQFEGAEAYGLCMQTARRALDAEDAAIGQIDAVLGWLMASSRYGLARLPGGRPVHYERGQARATAERGPLVLVRGLRTGRGWLRTRGAASNIDPLRVARPEAPGLPAGVPFDPARVRTLARFAAAAGAPGLLLAMSALAAALDSYARQRAAPPAPLGEGGLQVLLDALPGDLEPGRRARIQERIRELAQPSGSERLRAALQEDGVPLTARERMLLEGILAAPVASAERLSAREVEHAFAVAARLVVFGLGGDATYGPRAAAG
jgi:hypothetical protein